MVQGLQDHLSQILQAPTVLEFERLEKQKRAASRRIRAGSAAFTGVLIRRGPCLATLINMPPLAKMAAI